MFASIFEGSMIGNRRIREMWYLRSAQGVTLIDNLRNHFNLNFRQRDYTELLGRLQARSGAAVGFRVAETPVFLEKSLIDAMSEAGAALTSRLLRWPEYMKGARESIPHAFLVAGDSAHPNFLTADFALIRDRNGVLSPRLVEIQAFPSVYAYQAMLSEEYRQVFNLPNSLGVFLSGLNAESFWKLLRETILGKHDPKHVVLTEVDPWNQKTLPDFLLTAKQLDIKVVDIATLIPIGNKLHYRNQAGDLVPIHRIYNRAIADEMIARQVRLRFDLSASWDVEWAGHPNWYFLISKYAIPWLSLPTAIGEAGGGGVPLLADSVVPPAVFLEDFLQGEGFKRLETAGVSLPSGLAPETTYDDLLLKPLFSFAGKGIQFGPTRAELEAIPVEERSNYLLQQRMHFVPTIETPHGMTQVEIRILYLWPDGGELTPVLPLIRLGRGKMMGVDHNRDQEWVGGSAAFWQ